MRDIEPKHVPLSFIVAAGLLLSTLWWGDAQATERDCGDLASRLKSGDNYQLQLELQSQNIRINHGDDYCSEPANAWFARHIILPLPGKRSTLLPLSALEIPASKVPDSRTQERGIGVFPLPGQKMRQGALPNLGFKISGRDALPVPIKRTPPKPLVEHAAANEDVNIEPSISNAPEKADESQDAKQDKRLSTAEEKTENLIFWTIIIAMVFFLLGGVGLIIAVRNIRAGRNSDEEDGGDEEDEGEEP